MELFSMEDSLNVLKREFGRNICQNLQAWWFDQILGGRRYKHEDIYALFEKQQKIAPALDFIAKNYGQHLKNDDLAQLCNMSTVYFRKLFKEVMGKSPIEYIQTLKIEKAKEILKSDYGSISDIAYELVYQNIYDFSRTFKKIVGVSPKNFKKTYNI